MRILFIGDVVGSPGREMVEEYLPRLKRKYSPGLTIVNGENAASGKELPKRFIVSSYKQGLTLLLLVTMRGTNVKFLILLTMQKSCSSSKFS